VVRKLEAMPLLALAAAAVVVHSRLRERHLTAEMEPLTRQLMLGAMRMVQVVAVVVAAETIRRRS
jgi:hypothetical protein